MMNIIKSVYISLAVALIILGVPSSLAFATTVDYDDEPEVQEQCEEESDYDFLCSGTNGVQGKPFCDLHNATESIKVYPNMTERGCWYRTINPIAWCARFDDLTNTYEYCREVPGSEEYLEYMETGGPDESCLFDVYQIKCQPYPNTDDCPEDFGTNEDGYCFPMKKGEWRCPEGYHGTDEDESGQCYPNEGCEYDDYVLLEDRPDKMDRCAYLGNICDEGNENSDHPRCEEFLEKVAEENAERDREREESRTD